MKVISCASGPGAGKSTVSLIFAGLLKANGYNAEPVNEYAKDLTWRKKWATLKDQEHVFEEQLERMECLRGQVDFIITDTSLILGIPYINHAYEGDKEALKKRVIAAHKTFDNTTFFVRRSVPYCQAGRRQSLDEAKIKDAEILAAYHDVGESVIETTTHQAVAAMRWYFDIQLGLPVDIPDFSYKVLDEAA